MIIDEMKNGLTDYEKLQTIITENDVEIKSVAVAREIVAFLKKVEDRISNHKRIDLYCYEFKNPKDILEPSKAQEGWVVCGMFERGLGTRNYKQNHTTKVSMLNNWNTSEAQSIISVLNNSKNEWIYNNMKDESTKETLQKFMAFMTKYHTLLMNIEHSTINLKLSKEVSLPTSFLIKEYGNTYTFKVLPNVIEKIKLDTNDFQKIDIDTKDGKNLVDNRIGLFDYSRFYIIQQNYNVFEQALKEFKEQITDEIAKLSVLHKELKQDVDVLKRDLGHIFVADAI